MRSLRLLLAVACTGCEAVLGFGETSLGPGVVDVSAATNDASHPADGEAAIRDVASAGDATPDDSSGDDARTHDVDAGENRDVSGGDDATPEDSSGDDARTHDVDAGENRDVSGADGARGPDTGADGSRGDASDVDTESPTDGPLEDADGSTTGPESADHREGSDGVQDVSEDSPDGSGKDTSKDANWSPTDMPGLALWLDAAVGVETDGGGVASWFDQSANHHVAVAPYPAMMPKLLSQGIGTYPGVAFAGIGDILRIADAASLRFGTNDFVVEVVMRHSTPLSAGNCAESYAGVFLKQDHTSPFHGPGMFANGTRPGLRVQVTANDAAESTDGKTYNDDVPRLFGMFRRDVYLTLRINSNPETTVLTAREQGLPINVSANGWDAFLGGQPDKVQCLKGVIAEVVVASPVTAAETTALETYLLKKHPALSLVGGIAPKPVEVVK